jgi:hypothetical protein
MSSRTGATERIHTETDSKTFLFVNRVRHTMNARKKIDGNRVEGSNSPVGDLSLRETNFVGYLE